MTSRVYAIMQQAVSGTGHPTEILKEKQERQVAKTSIHFTVTATAVLPWSSTPLPRYYRVVGTRYRGNTAPFVPFTAVITAVTTVFPR
jgi:hypothetical protein